MEHPIKRLLLLLESFLLVLPRGNAKIVNKALVPPAVYKALMILLDLSNCTSKTV